MNLGWIWTQNVGCHCIIVIKHGLLCFVALMHGFLTWFDMTWSITMPTCIHNMYHAIQTVWLCWINHQSQSMTQVPVIYHLGNILIALWRNQYALEIRFTVELQFCQKLDRDHLCSPSSGEYFIILLDLLTIRPWRDHGSDWNVSGMLCTDLFLSFCIFRHF